MGKKRPAKHAAQSGKVEGRRVEKKGTKTNPTRVKGESTDDWISALAKKAASETVISGSTPLPSKEERKERRASKKRRRQDRKERPVVHSRTDEGDQSNVEHDTTGSPPRRHRMNRQSQSVLYQLSDALHTCTLTNDGESGAYQQPYTATDTVKKGKATAGNQLNEEVVQPRTRDYGGLGLARPSLLISLRDPSFVPRLEEEFEEHVPGFFGKQRTKAMKRQLDGNMLWRQLADKRATNQKVGGKKLSDMSPDEKVEAMIKAGMI